jgi:glycosyltransferase involved in cell wall biosynthesis
MKKIKILIPIYNDWPSVFKLLENIDLQFDEEDIDISVLIINDASTEAKSNKIFVPKNLSSVKVINMKHNRGHGRCNATGLKYINEKEDCDYVIPMDGDGEDRPEELFLLIKKLKDYPNKVITADRVKRSEGIIFKFCYMIHKYLTFVFTGQSIKFGNYTCLPKSIVNKMTNEQATWSSFSGSLAKIIKDRISVPSIRGKRYFGPSKMSFFNLVKHSLSIIAVFKTTLLIRSTLFLAIYLFLIIGNISLITLIPVVGVIVMMILVIILSRRENMSEFISSLENIGSIDKIK